MNKIQSRHHSKPEILKEMFAFEGKCTHCDGVVKMMRTLLPPFSLCPKACWCLQCGQIYHMEIDDLVTFEQEQWRQKK